MTNLRNICHSILIVMVKRRFLQTFRHCVILDWVPNFVAGYFTCWHLNHGIGIGVYWILWSCGLLNYVCSNGLLDLLVMLCIVSNEHVIYWTWSTKSYDRLNFLCHIVMWCIGLDPLFMLYTRAFSGVVYDIVGPCGLKVHIVNDTLYDTSR